MLSNNEQAKMRDVERRLSEMRAHLSRGFPPLDDTDAWCAYLAALKEIQGNASQDLSFVATLMAKPYLVEHYGLTGFDASAKAQGAPGLDIDVHLPDGRRLVAEIKTTTPYGAYDLGAQQNSTFQSDFSKLARAEADVKLFLLTDRKTFALMQKPKYQSQLHGVTVILLTTGEKFPP